jgi:hypothetical protein
MACSQNFRERLIDFGDTGLRRAFRFDHNNSAALPASHGKQWLNNKKETTMVDFKFTCRSRRRDSELMLSLTKTDPGWYISRTAINGNAEPDGQPMLSAAA